MNLVGRMIGNRYEILEIVGKGGMATVYKAKDHILNRFVAVKVLKDEYTTDEDFIKRFNTEAQSAASLSHPNIVSIYDVGHEEEDNLYYIVMELIKGKTLKDIIKKDGKLSWKWSVNIAIQIASALSEAHNNGIIHRDIKPHNIIITEDGTAKVTDFGIAKAVSNSTMTAFGTTIGSVHYFSPEQAKGGITDAKSDIYSLGVVMYEMLTGRVPFDADTPVSIALKHMQEKPKEPIEIEPDIPKAVNDIVMKAIQKKPIDRYGSADEMIADLKRALKDPNGDFVQENDYNDETKVLDDTDYDDEDDYSSSKKKNKKPGFFAEHDKTKRVVILLCLILVFVVVFLITKIAMGDNDKGEVDLPDLSGKTEAEANQILTSENLKLVIGETEASSDVEAGKVVSQEPPYEQGKKVKEGTTVLIHLSSGPEENSLPNWKGEKIEDVRAEAEKMGLKLEETEENSDKVDAGLVISQSPEKGSNVKSGDTIKVTVSKGVKTVSVPTVIGMDEATAKATLSNSGLKANVTYKSDETQTDGKVISQSKNQGDEVSDGSTIDIVVNKIEKNEKTIILTYKVPNDTTNTDTKSNTILSGSLKQSHKVSIFVGDQRVVNGKDAAGGETVSYSLKGSGSKKVEVQLDGKTVSTKTINIDEWDNGSGVSLN